MSFCRLRLNNLLLLHSSSGSSIDSAPNNVMPTVIPPFMSDKSDEPMGAPSMTNSSFTAALQAIHPPSILAAGSLRPRSHPTANLTELGSLAHQPQPITDMSVTGHAIELQGQGTSEMRFENGVFYQHHFDSASTRPVLDVDVEMEEPLQAYNGHVPALTSNIQMSLPTFSTRTIPVSQHSSSCSPFDPNQFTHPVQFHTRNDHQGQVQDSFGHSLNPNQLNLPFLPTSSNNFESFVGFLIFLKNSMQN